MRTLLFFFVSLFAFGQAGPGVLQPRRVPPTINYYVATTGSDTNPCTSASKCLTLAHVLTLIPQVLSANYIVNIADGTYAEPINTAGFIGSGSTAGWGQGPYSTSIELLGNLGSPANVIFSGAAQCDATFEAGACIQGSATIVLEGLTVTTAQRNGITCYGGVVQYNSVIVTLTGGPTLASVGIDNLGCTWDVEGNLAVTGFDTNTSPTGGLGIYNAHGTVGTLGAGTITITGPGGSTGDGTVCWVEEYAPSGFAMLGSSTNFTATGCNIGILLNDNSAFTAYASTGTITVTNTSTPTSSLGISTSGSAGFNVAGAALVMNHWTTCIQAAANSVVDQGGATRTLSNCGTNTNAIQGSQIILF